MNLAFFMEKLKHSEEYKKYVEKNKDAFLVSSFIALDYESGKKANEYHMDFFSPKSGKMVSLQLNEEVIMKDVELNEGFVAKEVSENSLDLEFDAIKAEIDKELANIKSSNKVNRIVAILHSLNSPFSGYEGDVYSCTIFLSMMGLAKAVVRADTGKVLFFEKKSLFDMMRKEK